MSIPLAKADRLAERIVAELAPFCSAIQVAGSIRRRRPFVGDVDIVCLPHPGQTLALVARARLATTLVRGGAQEQVLRLRDGTQLDLWIANQPTADLLDARPTNFGSLLLCRTGSREFNIWLIEHAKRMGLKWNPHHGVFRSTGNRSDCLASATEEDIFRILDLDFIPPERRERP